MESFRVLLRDLAVESGLVQQRDEVVVGGHRHVLHGAGEAGDGVAIDVAKAAQPLGVSIVARGVAALRLGRLRAGEDAYTVAARAAGVITVRVLVGIALGRSAQDSDVLPGHPTSDQCLDLTQAESSSWKLLQTVGMAIPPTSGLSL